MAQENSALEAAKRHLGVALIDLSYAESELRRCAADMQGLAAEEGRIAADRLADALFKLRTIGERIHDIGRIDPDGLSLSDLSRWWPTQIGRRSSRAD